MTLSDPIADMLTRIKNGYMAGKVEVVLPWSKIKEKVANLLAANNYLTKTDTRAENGRKELALTLKYDHKKPAMTQVRRVSKPSLRWYVSKDNLPRVLGGAGLAIISTPQGLMTNKEAWKRKIGGEVLCEVW